MSRVSLDYNFAIKESVGCGFDDEIDACKDKAKKGLSRFIEMSENGENGIPGLAKQDTTAIRNFAKEVRGKYNDLIVIGIGGSSLGFEAICNASLPYGHNALSFAERGGTPRVWVADNVDPYKSHWIMKNCVPQDTLLCVITKSGTTVETIANFSLFYKWIMSTNEDLSQHIVCVTDKNENELRKFANQIKSVCFDIPTNVGGRNSVLSPVGLVPASILGLEINKFVHGAEDVIKLGVEQVLMLSAIYIYFIEKGFNINIMMPYSSRCDAFSKWFCQLWAESLGKREDLNNNVVNFGTTPVAALGASDQHSQLQLYKEGPLDKLITFIQLENHDFDKEIENVFSDYFKYLEGKNLGDILNIELQTTEMALKNAGKPSIRLVADVLDEHTLGYLFMLYQYVVPVIGLSYDINPFNQPGVEEGKNYVYGLLGRSGFENKKEKFLKEYIKEDDNIV